MHWRTSSGLARDLHTGSQSQMGGVALNASPDPRVEEIAAAIERYLALNPSAADNTLGIAQWWLPAVGAEGALAEVERAVRLLEARRVMEGVRVGNRQQFWRAAPGQEPAGAQVMDWTDPGHG